MKKKEYEKPSVEVVVLKQPHLLAGSVPGDVNATMNGTFEEETI